MKTKLTPAGFDARRHLRILKAILIATNSFVLFMYASIFFIFADMPFVAVEQLKVIGNSMGWATGFGVCFSFLIFAGDGLTYLVRQRKQVKFTNGTGTPAATPNYNSAPRLIMDMPARAMDNFNARNN